MRAIFLFLGRELVSVPGVRPLRDPAGSIRAMSCVPRSSVGVKMTSKYFILPFDGRKERWARELESESSLLPYGATVVDVFGGSGCVSRIVKDSRPDLHVVWNDFDDFASRIAHIDETEELRKRLVRRFGGALHDNDYAIRDVDALRSILDTHRKAFGYLDEKTVLRWLTQSRIVFSNFDKALKSPFNRFPHRPLRIDAARHYLAGLERVQFDAKLYTPDTTSYLVLDPPYFGTTCVGYKHASHGGVALLDVTARLLPQCRGFLLFGALSAREYYARATAPYKPRYMEKSGFSVAFDKTRTEICFSTF